LTFKFVFTSRKQAKQLSELEAFQFVSLKVSKSVGHFRSC